MELLCWARWWPDTDEGGMVSNELVVSVIRESDSNLRSGPLLFCSFCCRKRLASERLVICCCWPVAAGTCLSMFTGEFLLLALDEAEDRSGWPQSKSVNDVAERLCGLPPNGSEALTTSNFCCFPSLWLPFRGELSLLLNTTIWDGVALELGIRVCNVCLMPAEEGGNSGNREGHNRCRRRWARLSIVFRNRVLNVMYTKKEREALHRHRK